MRDETIAAMERAALNATLQRLEWYGTARDRLTERKPRSITLLDDEALALVRYIKRLEGAE